MIQQYKTVQESRTAAEVNRVSVRFGNRPVFTDFSCRFREGSVTAVMGTSGCGKTTLLRLLAGLLKPDTGTVTAPEHISFLFQEPRLCPWLSAVENVNLVLGDRRRTLPLALAFLSDVGLGQDADKYPSELSGGMQHRVALARTLAYDAPLILLDEPFVGLDRDTKERMIALVRKRTAGKTVVLVTHEAAVAEALAGEILTL